MEAGAACRGCLKHPAGLISSEEPRLQAGGPGLSACVAELGAEP